MADSMDEHVTSSLTEEDLKNGDSDDEEDMEEDAEKDESESSDEDDELQDSAISELESKVSSNPYEYSHHVELIKLLRKVGELDRLRHANQCMSELFPLTAELWLEWIRDETNLISSTDDREKIEQLFERAVKDYVSPDVWLEYCQFCIGGIGTAEGINKARNVFEQALTAVGLHVSRGNDVWEVYREFESALLRNMQLQQGATVLAEDKTITEQTERVAAIFRRQLSVPLLDMEDTFEEYESWLSEAPTKNVKQMYEKALATLKKCYPYEQQLLNEDSRKYASYMEYIKHERTQGNPARVQCLYERAVTDDCLHIELWKDYTKYLDSELKIKSVVLPVYARAVRNCPWSVDLWQGYLIAMERYEEPHSNIIESFEKAMNAGFSSPMEYLGLWQTHIDYLRRRIDWSSEHEEELLQLRTVLERAGEHLATYFGAEGDPTCSIQQYWARMEAKYCHNMDTARSQWNEIMALGHANEAQMWLNYFNLERSYGDVKHCRKILHRAIASVSDYPECLFEALVDFEREEGNLETWENALKRVEIQTIRVDDMRSKTAKDEQRTDQDTQQRLQGVKPKGKQANKKQDRNSKAVKRKLPEEPFKKPARNVAPGDSKKSSDGGDIFKMPLPPPAQGTASPVTSALSQQADVPPVKKAKVEESPVQSQPGVRWGPPPKDKPGHDSSKDHLTIFVKNLTYEMTEAKIRNIFSQCGVITDVRMVENYRHQFRGYCYIEFKQPSSVDEALKMDRQSVEGRPMFVDRSMDKTKVESKPSFQYEIKMEKNKLFLSGLPRSATDESLEKLFSQYGKVKNVRIVTYRSGVPKGLAYVEFEQESDAAKAVIGADNTVVDGHTISVAISNPPTRKPKKDEAVETPYPPKSLGAKGSVGPRGKGRTQLSLVPRALQRPSSATPQVPKKASQEEGTTKQDKEEVTGVATTTGRMSNADFAKMLLKK